MNLIAIIFMIVIAAGIIFLISNKSISMNKNEGYCGKNCPILSKNLGYCIRRNAYKAAIPSGKPYQNILL